MMNSRWRKPQQIWSITDETCSSGFRARDSSGSNGSIPPLSSPSRSPTNRSPSPSSWYQQHLQQFCCFGTSFIELWLTISTYSIRKQSGVVMPSLMLKRRFKTVLLYFHPAKWSTMVVWFDSSLENCLEQIVKPLPRNFRRVSISPSCRLSDNCLRSYWSLMCRSSSGNLHLFNLLCCSHSPLPQLPVRVVGEPRHPCLPAVSWAWSCSPCNVDIWKKNRFIWLYL